LARELTVAIGHGHAHVRAGIRQILLDEGVAGTIVAAGSCKEMEALLRLCHPQVVVLGDSFPGQSIQEQLAIFRRIDPSVRFIVLSGYPHDSVTDHLEDAGADAVVMEERIIDDLVTATQCVRRGEHFSCRGLVEDSLRWTAGIGDEPPVSALSSKDLTRTKPAAGSPSHSSSI